MRKYEHRRCSSLHPYWTSENVQWSGSTFCLMLCLLTLGKGLYVTPWSRLLKRGRKNSVPGRWPLFLITSNIRKNFIIPGINFSFTAKTVLYNWLCKWQWAGYSWNHFDTQTLFWRPYWLIDLKIITLAVDLKKIEFKWNWWEYSFKKNKVSSFSLDLKPKYLGIVRDYSHW